MGDEADARLNGECCEYCGMYIGNAVGDPRYCSDECAINSGAVTDPAGYSGWKEAACSQLNKSEK